MAEQPAAKAKLDQVAREHPACFLHIILLVLQFLPTHSLTQIIAPLPAVVFPHLQPGSKEEPPPPTSPWSLASKRIRPAGKVGQAPALNVAGCSPLEQLLAGTQAPGPQTEEPLCAPLPYTGAQASFLFIPCCQDPTVRNSAPPCLPLAPRWL